MTDKMHIMLNRPAPTQAPLQTILYGEGKARRALENAAAQNCSMIIQSQPEAQAPDLNGSDAIILDCPPDQAIPIIETALAQNIHVLAAQSVTETVEQMIALRRAEANSPKGCLKFLFPLRQHSSVLKALTNAKNDQLGSLLFMRAIYGSAQENNAALGCLDALGGNMIDLMNAFGGPFQDVQAIIGTRHPNTKAPEDNAMALLRNHDGIMAMLHSSTTQWRQTFRLELGYQHGYLWLDGLSSEQADFGPEMLISAHCDPACSNPEEEIEKFDDDNCWDREIQDFLNGIQNATPFANGSSMQAFDVINTVQRLRAADRSFLS